MQAASASSHLGCTADPHDMPETSDRDGLAHTGSIEPPPLVPAPDAREQEATELAAVRRQYSRASSHRRPDQGRAEREPESSLGRLSFRIAQFWRRQVSIIVPHDSCRDHLGTAPSILSFCIRLLYSTAFLFKDSEAGCRNAILPGGRTTTHVSLSCDRCLSPPSPNIF